MMVPKISVIQDIIDYIEAEDDEAILIFLDQQKAFDRIHILRKKTVKNTR